MALSSLSLKDGASRQAIVRQFKETIIQLCRSSVLFAAGGCVEIDGIICISGQVEGQDLVVKVHEVLREDDGGLSKETAHRHPAFRDREQLVQQHQGRSFYSSNNHHNRFLSANITPENDPRYADNGGSEMDAKRRKLERFDAAMQAAASGLAPSLPAGHHSSLYSYLTRLSYDTLGSRAVNDSLGPLSSSTSSTDLTDYQRLVAAATLASGARDLSTKQHHHQSRRTHLAAPTDESPPMSLLQEGQTGVKRDPVCSPSPASSSTVGVVFRSSSSSVPATTDEPTCGTDARQAIRSGSPLLYLDNKEAADSTASAAVTRPHSGHKRPLTLGQWAEPSPTSRLGPPPPLLQSGIASSASGVVIVPQCIACGFSFSSAEALGDHNESAHSIFTCLCCFKTFTSRSNLERHSRLHTGHRPYSCPVCGKTFSRKDHLSNHATKHAYKCAACSRRCPDRPSLAEHFRLEHSGATLAAVCAYCNKGFGSVEMFEEHVKVHPQFHAAAIVASTAPIPPPSSSLFQRRSFQRSGRQQYGEGLELNDASQSGLVFSSFQPVAHRRHESSSSLTPSSSMPLYDLSSLGIDGGFDVTSSTSRLLPSDESSAKLLTCSVCRQTCSTLHGLRQHEMLHVYEMADAGRLSRTRNFDAAASHFDEMPIDRRLGQQRHSDYADLYHRLEEMASKGNPGSGSGIPMLLSAEDQSVVHHRDKRKQKQPKPVMQIGLLDDDPAVDEEDEEVNVVSPEPSGDMHEDPDESATPTDRERLQPDVYSNGPEDDEATVDAANEIKMEPIRSIMNGTKSRSRERHRGEQLGNFSNSERSGESGVSSGATVGYEDGLSLTTGANMDETSSCNGWPKDASAQNASHLSSAEGSHRESTASVERAPVTSKSLMMECSMQMSNDNSDEIATINNNNNNNNYNNGAIKSEAVWSESPVPSGAASAAGSYGIGPQRCVVCGLECIDFNDLEAHCVTEHSRSPCMFCSKTFAQKANRDRHVCLHTGDRPYGCPECGERFSRGDKLKMHRVRTHGVLYPLYGSRGGGHHRNRSSGSPSSTYAGDLGMLDVGAGRDVDSSFCSRDQDSGSPAESRNRSASWNSVVPDWSGLRGRNVGVPSSHPWSLTGGSVLDRFPKVELLTDDEGREGNS